MTQLSKLSFDKRVDQALKDPFLKSSLKNAQDKFRNNKENAYEALGNLEEWRTRAEAVRTHTIKYLDYYLDQFITNAEKSGIHIHFALTDEEAVQTILAIAKEKEAKTMIKSKSMVSEEVHLNHRLEEVGVTAIESDLGEYIIQLAKEVPSHIIAPAIHKNRTQIAELFSKLAGETIPDDTPSLTSFAKNKLRQQFLQADIGLSGCNFAIAESGGMVLVSNEGNARLTTTLPKTHIVMMGIERIVPTWDDLDSIISLLARSATGQKLTSYLTFLNGPRRAAEQDGPEEMHIVIVDNGRTNALGSEYQAILNCIRCGACLNVCPVYRHIGGHAYGSVYPGPIGAVLTPILSGFSQWEELPYASSLCGACTETCPVKIPLHDYLIDLRRDEVNEKRSDIMERIAFKAFATAVKHPRMYTMGLKMAKLALRPQTKHHTISKGLGPLKGWTKARELAAPAKQSFRDWWQKEGSKEVK